MHNHVSLMIVLSLILLWEYHVARAKYHHHWCGVRLLHAVFVESLFPMFVILLIYIDIFHTGQSAINERYWYLLSAVGAVSAHFVVHRFFLTAPKAVDEIPPQTRQGLPLMVATRIEQKKLAIAAQLRGSPHCRELLLRGINASPEMPVGIRNRLLRAVRQQQTDQEIFSVIEKVGVAKMKLIVKGSHDGDYARATATQSNS